MTHNHLLIVKNTGRNPLPIQLDTQIHILVLLAHRALVWPLWGNSITTNILLVNIQYLLSFLIAIRLATQIMANVLSSQHGVYWLVSGAWFCEYIFLLLSITWHSHSYCYHSNLQRLWGDRWKCYQKPNGIVNPGWPYIPQKLWSCYFTAMPLSALKHSLVTPLFQLNAILTLACLQNCWEAGPHLWGVDEWWCCLELTGVYGNHSHVFIFLMSSSLSVITSQQCYTSRSYTFLRQNQHLDHDRGPYGTSTTHQSHEHTCSRIPSKIIAQSFHTSSTSPSSQVYSPEYIHQENSWATQQLPQLYFETSENLCINWDHDVWSSRKFVIHIHTMCCLHGWHPGSYHALQSCQQNITSDFCQLLVIWGWFSTLTTHCSYHTQAEANYLLQCRSWRS